MIGFLPIAKLEKALGAGRESGTRKIKGDWNLCCRSHRPAFPFPIPWIRCHHTINPVKPKKVKMPPRTVFHSLLGLFISA